MFLEYKGRQSRAEEAGRERGRPGEGKENLERDGASARGSAKQAPGNRRLPPPGRPALGPGRPRTLDRKSWAPEARAGPSLPHQIQALIHQGSLAREWLYQKVYLHCGKSAWSSSLLMVINKSQDRRLLGLMLTEVKERPHSREKILILQFIFSRLLLDYRDHVLPVDSCGRI